MNPVRGLRLMLIIAHLLPGGGLQGIEPRKGIATNAVLEWEYNEVSVQLQGIEPRKGIATRYRRRTWPHLE